MGESELCGRSFPFWMEDFHNVHCSRLQNRTRKETVTLSLARRYKGCSFFTQHLALENLVKFV